MSYCVNCGVELAASEKHCPLCGVQVQNPAAPWVEPAAGPYPKRIEHIVRRIDRRYGALLATLALLIPVLCTALIDLLMTHELSWSGYVTGAAVCIFVGVLLPMLFKKPNPYLCILLDTLALQAYMAAILQMTAGLMKYVTFAMPLVFIASGYAFLIAALVGNQKLKGTLYKPAIATFMVAVLCVLVELVADVNVFGRFEPLWSLIAAAPCIVVGAMLLVIESKQQLKDKIRRRLFV